MRGIIGLCLVSVFVSCATKKKVTPQPTKAPIIVVDSAKIKAETVQVPQIQNQDPEETSLPVILTTEDRVRLMMREGINKQADWTEAMHYDLRKPNYVIIHHTAQTSIAQTIRTFQVPHAKVSSHYVIGRDGQVVQMLNDYLRAWHAGRSKWGNITDINSMSIGIELDNSGKEPFSEAQISALLTLLDTLKTKYQIPFTNFIGHADIAPTRKDDPSVFFPWKRLAQNGFGVWYDESNLEMVPENFNYVDALRIIGYDVTNLKAAITAFKRKFIVVDVSDTMTAYDRRILYNVYRRYF
ncbi:N-acetylmuramoyl-L-alanine amidase [Sphingobacterium psychroaquaticum]|uniref:N-acetylmuramoyl-L-alanine amidase n=1 Tax=Sphingobacterium psychroaquaticum TaxID=561061 RepID=A0A1X7KD74_9SPHI|nr:N-acetylmuramoyl-L-alanine amidase [Sphingobacterium psychroaquaticum]SMG38840.1 N-acetylmuramoyl-L-alanine amidase [Sphingobacterium psychroaquaticum]